MADFLTTKGISAEIEKIITGATSRVVLISPYLQISKEFNSRLSEASERGVMIFIVFGKKQLKLDELDGLAKIKGLEVRFLENLHAKCYINETKLIIASMNLYTYSEKNNVEMGVLIDYKNDTFAFEKAKQEVECIIKSSELISLKNLNQPAPKIYSNKVVEIPIKQKKESNSGYCICCDQKIGYYPKRPYCGECYQEWDGEPDTEEDFCHCCGMESETSMDYPECYPCYTSHK